MWSYHLLGTDTYSIVQWFFFYSILGWIVESIYMSFCNGHLTNRGFVTGPICPIYGIGALAVYFLLRPLEEHYFLLYFMGAAIATLFEFCVAKLMMKLFGQVWWDYNDKPFNYKGILCLESTVAWGFYTLFLFRFLHRFVMGMVSSYTVETGIFFAKILIVLFTIDLCHSLYQLKKEEINQSVSEIRERLCSKW